MSKFHDDRYDEMKSLLKKTKLLYEQETRLNIGKSIEDRIQRDSSDDTDESGYETADSDDETKKEKDDKVQKYKIGGGILALHGKEREKLQITTDDKAAFMDTMDEFIEEVSDLVDFNELNVYTNNVEWSGKIIDQDMDFIFTIGESNGIYINGNAVKVDQDFLDMINKLQRFYEKFKSRWSKIVAQRKITKE
jgi:hypothetical protein